MNVTDLTLDQSKRLQSIGKEFGKYWSAQFAEMQDLFKPFLNELEQFPDNLKKLLPYLLKRGWYVFYETPISLVNQCTLLMAEGKHAEIERILCAHARNRIAATQDALTKTWPTRAVILNDAYEAMTLGKYTLSIPVMLAQADGILCEVFKLEQFFSAKHIKSFDNNHAYSLIISNPRLNVLDFLSEELIKDRTIRASRKDRQSLRQDKTIPGVFNRHEILHGEAVDYATEGNALRSVMLLDFSISIYNAVKVAKQHKNETNSDYRGV